jgi:hypothetical protein
MRRSSDRAPLRAQRTLSIDKAMRYCLRLALLASTVSAAQAEGLTLGGGVDYTSGKYTDTETTHILYLPFYGRYETERWTFKATVPYIHIEGPGTVVGGGEVVTVPGSARRTDSGLGDIVASAFYNLLHESYSFVGLDVGMKVKFGTADESIGTGENDYALQADFFKPLGANTVFGSLAYRWYGDPPGIELRDVFYGSIGVSHRFSSDTSAGIAYDYRPPIVDGGGPISELTGFVSKRLSPQLKLQPYLVVGFADASPDFGVGAQVSYSY